MAQKFRNQNSRLMNYKEKITTAIKIAEENLAIERKLKEQALATYERRRQEEEAPINRLVEQYFDAELKDKDGTTVREGYVISNIKGYPAYKVIKRGMQFVFGTPIFNPSVNVVTYSSKGVGKKVKNIDRSELSEMQIIFDASNLGIKIQD